MGSLSLWLEPLAGSPLTGALQGHIRALSEAEHTLAFEPHVGGGC